MLEDGFRTFSDAVIGFDDDDDENDEGEEKDVNKDIEDKDVDDGFCFVTKAGSVVTCQ